MVVENDVYFFFFQAFEMEFGKGVGGEGCFIIILFVVEAIMVKSQCVINLNYEQF